MTALVRAAFVAWLLSVTGAAQAATLDVTCDDLVPGANIDFPNIDLPSPLPDFNLPDVNIPGLVNICSNSDMTEVETVVNGQQNQIDAVVAQNNTQWININNNRADIDTLITTTNNHETRITSLEGAVSDHETRISEIETDIAALTGGMTNLREDMTAGIAMANAMDVFLPDPGASFRLNVGIGHFGGTNAFGITGSGRLGDGDTAVYFGASKVSGNSLVGAKAGISFQW